MALAEFVAIDPDQLHQPALEGTRSQNLGRAGTFGRRLLVLD